MGSELAATDKKRKKSCELLEGTDQGGWLCSLGFISITDKWSFPKTLNRYHQKANMTASGDTVQKLLDLHKVRSLIIWTSHSCINSAFNIQRNTNKICVSLSQFGKNVSLTILKLLKCTEKEKLERFTVFITLFRELVKCKDKSSLCKVRCSI